MTARLRTAALWLTPLLFCLWVYWYGLNAWFQQDDFAWLGLRLQVHTWADLRHALFAPMAQGSIRPWSERGFFMLFSSLFGIEALPFRLWVFLTQVASLLLLIAVTRKLTASLAAGAAAALLWTANPGLSVPMSWTSAYNEVLCAFFLLLAFYLFLRYVETANSSYYAAQFIVFLFGFGALELNVVYPMLVASYALFCARKYLWKTLPLFPVSGLYAVIHRAAAPQYVAEPYRMHWDASIATTLWSYWEWVLAAARLPALRPLPIWFVPAITALLTVVILGFVLSRSLRRDQLGWFFLSWFLIVLAPVLPLRDHFTDYYLAIPSAGLAMLGGWAMVATFRNSKAIGAVALCLAGVYLYCALPVTRAVSRWHYDRGRSVRTLALGVARAHQLHQGKLILLDGVSSDLFWAGVYDRPFRLYGAEEVYLVPGSDRAINAHPEIGSTGNYVLSTALAKRALDRGQAVVYRVGDGRLHNITTSYRERTASTWKLEQPRYVDVGQALFDDLLDAGWYPLEGSYRWMQKHASLRMGGPARAGDKLYISGFCPQGQLGEKSVKMTVTMSGLSLGVVTPDRLGAFEATFSIPASVVGRDEVQIVLDLNRTFTPPGDSRTLGLAFGTFALR